MNVEWKVAVGAVIVIVLLAVACYTLMQKNTEYKDKMIGYKRTLRKHGLLSDARPASQEDDDDEV